MIGLDVKPDVVVYVVLINAFADAESVKEALGYVDAMKRAGFNQALYRSLVLKRSRRNIQTAAAVRFWS